MNPITLKIDNVSLIIPGLDKPILSHIHYEVAKGDFIIILGSNGSGKSSLLKLLDRRYKPTAGNILLDDVFIEKVPVKSFHRKVITLTQDYHESLFSTLTVFENCLLAKQRQKTELFSLPKKEEKHFFMDYLQEFNPNLPQKMDQIVDNLSGGEKQALALALSVLTPPEILLLDEHTSALDPKSAGTLMALTQRVIEKHHITCLLTTHDLDIALQYGNKILSLRHGEVYQTIDETKKKALNQQDLLAACY